MDIRRVLKQKALYWGTPQSDGYGGFTFALPIVVEVRWEDRVENYIDASGETKVSQAIVYLLQDVVVGGYFCLLTSEEATSFWELSEQGTQPLTASDAAQYVDPQDSAVIAYRVMRFGKIPDIKANKFLRKVWL
jgi:hypothetical protein